jgi:hypothetical protein
MSVCKVVELNLVEMRRLKLVSLPNSHGIQLTNGSCFRGYSRINSVKASYSCQILAPK